MTDPISETELRDHARTLADGLLADGLISFIAVLRDDGLASGEMALLTADEWSKACHTMGQMAAEMLEDYRTGGENALNALAESITSDVDKRVEDLIAERQASLRDVDEPAGPQ